MRTLFILALSTSLASAADISAPNPQLTPGATRPDLSTRTICNTRWGTDHRHVNDAMKLEVYRSYGFTGPSDPRCPCEIDHLVSRELGGADSKLNLWPQPYRGLWNAHMKDRLENRLHTELCAGHLTLGEAQSSIRNWIPTYIHYFGASK